MFKQLERIFSDKAVTAAKTALPASMDNPPVSPDFFKAKEVLNNRPVEASGSSSFRNVKRRSHYHAFFPVDDGRTHY